MIIAWRKSSRSGGGGNAGNCVEVGAWRKSSRSGGGGNGGNCVEVGQLADTTGIAVRDTKHRTGAVFTFTPATWSGFVRDIKSGTFDVA